MELDCRINPKEPFSDVVIADLAGIGFDMFEEYDSGIKGYILLEAFDESLLGGVTYFAKNSFCVVEWSKKVIRGKNWNEEWEKNFEPVGIDHKVLVRATFHPSQPGFEYEIVIQPKMSFGTGHHETTALVISRMLTLDFKTKSVLDMGCGSGILAIFSGMLGAGKIWAVDYDANSTENAIENCNSNGFPNVLVKTGSTEVLKDQKFDVILANINRNILLEQISIYSQCLNENGTVVLSGFYEEDIPVLLKEAEKYGFSLAGKASKNKWSELYLMKN